MKAYQATVTREGKWWLIAIPELDGLTQARRLSEAELMAREWIAVTLDVPLESVNVEVSVTEIDGFDVAATLQRIHETRNQAEALEDEGRALTQDLVIRLAGEGVPVRDIGAMLGVSFQRAHQLLQEPGRKVRAPEASRSKNRTMSSSSFSTRA